MSQTLSVKSFRCVENTSQFNEEFLENYCEDSNEGYFFEVVVKQKKELHELQNNLRFFA